MAFQQGLSGLNVSAKALDVISNNIANASTIGFKGGQAQFADVYAASLGVGGASQVGIGASLPVVQQQFSQGNISNSNNPLDIAVNGSGFFRLQKNATDQTITYTRNGQFHLDSSGYVVNAQKNNLTGYPISNGVTNRASLVPVQLDTSGVAPRATGDSSTNAGIVTQINLDDRDLKSLTSATPNNLAPWSANTKFPPNNLNTFNYSTSVTVYDQKGNDHALSMYFTRVADSSGVAPARNLWETHYVMDSVDITRSIVGGTQQGTGIPTLEFGADGAVVKSGFASTGTISKTGESISAVVPGNVSLGFAPASGSVSFTDLNGGTVGPYVEGVDYTLTATGLTFPSTSSVPTGQKLLVSYTTGTTATATDTVSLTQVTDQQKTVTVPGSLVLGTAPLTGTVTFKDANGIAISPAPVEGTDFTVNSTGITFPSVTGGPLSTGQYQISYTTTSAPVGPGQDFGLAFAPDSGSVHFWDPADPTNATELLNPATGAPYVQGTDYNVTNAGISFPTGSAFPSGQAFSVSYTTGGAALSTDYQFNIDVASLSTLHPEFDQLFPQDIALNFDNSTLFGSGYDVNKLTQDGYPYGRLSGVAVSTDGIIRGNYSNGQTKDIAQLVLVDFIAPTGLASLGNNQWGETSASGQPLVGDPGTGNRGSLQAAAVEEANVDLTQELVNLITQQRNYQANAQSIKTQDQVLQTLVNLR
jgi:flagellar hook protein FlgE